MSGLYSKRQAEQNETGITGATENLTGLICFVMSVSFLIKHNFLFSAQNYIGKKLS